MFLCHPGLQSNNIWGSLHPSISPIPVRLTPFDAAHGVVVGLEAEEWVLLDHVTLAHLLQDRFCIEVPDGHGAWKVEKMVKMRVHG